MDKFIESMEKISIEDKKTGFTEVEVDYILSRTSLVMGDVVNEHGGPLSGSSDLKAVFSDGVLLCKILNKMDADGRGDIDDSKIILNKGAADAAAASFAYSSNRDMIVKCVNDKRFDCASMVTPEAIEEGNAEVLVSLLWDNLLAYLTKSMLYDADTKKAIAPLLTASDKKNLSKGDLNTAQVLARWINYHLVRSTWDVAPVTNLTSDLADGTVLSIVLYQLDHSKCPTDAISPPVASLEERAEIVVKHSEAIGCGGFASAQAIREGIELINLCYIADLFTQHPTWEKTELTPATDNADLAEILRWIDGLGIFEVKTEAGAEPASFEELGAIFSDSISFLRIMERVKPGCVDWSKVKTSKLNKFIKKENLDYVVSLLRGDTFGCSVDLSSQTLIDGDAEHVRLGLKQIMNPGARVN